MSVSPPRARAAAGSAQPPAATTTGRDSSRTSIILRPSRRCRRGRAPRTSLRAPRARHRLASVEQVAASCIRDLVRDVEDLNTTAATSNSTPPSTASPSSKPAATHPARWRPSWCTRRSSVLVARKAGSVLSILIPYRGSRVRGGHRFGTRGQSRARVVFGDHALVFGRARFQADRRESRWKFGNGCCQGRRSWPPHRS